MKRNDNRSKSVTMADIAKELGVSVVTVSNAIAGKKGVSSDLRAEILLKAREIGYSESALPDAKPTAAKEQSCDIGIIAPQRYLNEKNDFHWKLYQEIITQLKRFNSYAILDAVSTEDEKNLRVPRIIENNLVSGLIMLGRPDLKFLAEINKHKIPIVFLDFSIRDFDFSCVAGDDYYDMYRLASFVISHGHSNICFVAENAEEIRYDRYYGCCSAMAESGLTPLAAKTVENAIESMEAEKITAFLCEDRNVSLELMKRLKEMSVSVPETVSVACFSDIKPEDEAEMTCICRDPGQMAKIAVDLLRVKLSGEGKNIGRTAIGGKIIVGKTVRSLLI